MSEFEFNVQDLPLEQQKEVAAWRRAGKGVWHIVVGVYGYDGFFGWYLPGGLSKKFATAVAKRNVAKQLGERISDTFIVEMTKES